MAGALRNTMVWLGLAEEDERADGYYDEEYDDYADERREEAGTPSADVTPLHRRTPVASVVKDPEVGVLNRITTIHPRTYNEAKNIGESFREGVPVIMNLSDMDDADAKRLVDFAAGLVFGLHGSIERVTAKVFLLSPSHVEVSGEEQAPGQPRGLFNQS